MLKSLWLRIGPTVQMSLPKTQALLDAVAIHRDLVAAIVARDAPAALDALRRDIFYTAAAERRPGATRRRT